MKRNNLPSVCERCGCLREFHEHYRAGTDCSVCGRWACNSFVRKRSPIAEFLNRLLGKV